MCLQVPLHARIAEQIEAETTRRTGGTPAAGASVRSSRSPAPPRRTSNANDLPDGAVLPPPQTVADFAAAHTTEDQASMEEIFASEAARRRERLQWMYQESARTNAQAAPDASRALEAPDVATGVAKGGSVRSASNAHQPPLLQWRHTAKSHLYHAPETHLALSSAERALMPTGAPPATVAQNTRFRSDDDNAATLGGAVGATPSTIPSTNLSPTSSSALPDTDSALGEPQIGGAQFRGYNRLATPSPSPGMLGAPIMTWGEVAGTPQRLPGDTPAVTAGANDGTAAVDGASGRDFIGAELSQQERAARAASRQMAASKGGVKKKALHGRSRYAGVQVVAHANSALLHVPVLCLLVSGFRMHAQLSHFGLCMLRNTADHDSEISWRSHVQFALWPPAPRRPVARGALYPAQCARPACSHDA